MRTPAHIPALLATALALAGCIIVPPQNACVYPTPTPATGAATGTTGGPGGTSGASAASPGTTGTPSTGTSGGGTGTGPGAPGSSPAGAATPTPAPRAVTLRVGTTLPGDPRVITLSLVPTQLTATATDTNGNPIATAFFRYDPDPGTDPNLVTIDNRQNIISLTHNPAAGQTVSGTIRLVTPDGQASSDADSLRVGTAAPVPLPSVLAVGLSSR